MKVLAKFVLLAAAGAMGMSNGVAFAQVNTALGKVTGSVYAPSEDNLKLVFDKGAVVLPIGEGDDMRLFFGKSADMPATPKKIPFVVFMHGSSGIWPEINDFQRWLAGRGIGSLVPDSLAIPNRLSYSSPVDKDTYEKVHALRLAELEYAIKQVKTWPQVDAQRVIVVGTSEGSVAVGRLPYRGEIARIIYSWSCEGNYFVKAPDLKIPVTLPVLNVISARDPYFSPVNPWNKGYEVTSNCAAALKNNPKAKIEVLDAKAHTVIDRPEVLEKTGKFLDAVLKSN